MPLPRAAIVRPVVLFLLESPRLKILAIEFIDAAGTGGNGNAFDGARAALRVPNLGPPLQGALADGKGDVRSEQQGLVDRNRFFLANLDGVLRGFRRLIHQVIIAVQERGADALSPCCGGRGEQPSARQLYT